MTTNEKLAALREIMERECVDAYIVSGTDPHNSEYLPAAWRQREWISGFTGSFGTLVVTKEKAGLWTDTRYFIQAEKQLAGTNIKLHKLRIPDAIDYPEWLAANLTADDRVGLDSFCIPVKEMQHLKDVLNERKIKLAEKTDLIGEIWLDRPALPTSPIFSVPMEITGISVLNKINQIREVLAENGADYFLFSSLDEIAWLYNIRCNDIDYNPVAISYAVIGKEKTWLFVKRQKVSAFMQQQLAENGIEILDYHHLFLFLDEIDAVCRFCVDTNTLNFAVYNRIVSKFPVIDKESPIIYAKAIKNPIEIEGFKKTCIEDGVAMTKFFHWLECNISNNLTEIEVSDKLTSFRSQNKGYISDSFGNISAYGPNAALPHYTATPGEDSVLQACGLYLVDSGAQYEFGTTDITRTIPLGQLTYLEKEDYTLVLKGMIDLTLCIFPKGTSGCNIDAIARQPLWQKLRNFGHGTGHGIGFFLNVHEGPQAIRQDLKKIPVVPGMVTSNEPGLYREGSHGIRHENMILCVSLAENEFAVWYGFETLTLCYFDTSAILSEFLNKEEKEWLNEYNHTVYEKISPLLTNEEAVWLAKKTNAID